jgi:hypothetical protein
MQMNRLTLLLALPLCICQPVVAQTEQHGTTYWPKQFEADGIVITIYAPEPEQFENNVLDARAAFSIFDGQKLPIFGAMWFQCRVHTNTVDNEVYFTDIELVTADFPSATASEIERLGKLIAGQIPSWHFNSNLQRFYANVKVTEINAEYSDALQYHPPKIFYSDTPSVLVYIDGDPILEDFKTSALYQYVVNTPHFIVHSSSDNQYYLKGAEWWYTSTDLYDGWRNIDAPPAAIEQLANQAQQFQTDARQAPSNHRHPPPRIVAVSEPAALVQTDGEPQIKQVHDNLFSITNSNDEIVFDSYTDHYYILVSGRWYRTKNLKRGSWTFVAPDALPEVFAQIPPSSPLAHLRLSVAGTPEAARAALDNGIPQTAVVDRKKAKMTIQYDGDPVFELIDGTALRYAINTSGSVIQGADGKYYAVDQAIWFVSEKPIGPWLVADRYPTAVKNIPPRYPVFNMKFVNIYDSTEDIVFIGYTGGYVGAFLYRGVVFYGTGYRYKSWYGNIYIPGPSTYGNGARKKSKNGPNISFYAASGYGVPMMGVGFGGYPYGMGWGMGYGGYAMWNQAAYNRYYYAGQSVKLYADEEGPAPVDIRNIYKNRKEGIIATETVIRNKMMDPIILKDPQEDLYVDEDGKLYRQDATGSWYEQHGNEWVRSPANPRR